MNIALDQLKPSPQQIRSSWSEEAMDELVASIKEQGLIVPIKVRPFNGGYEIVYGHRRAEACHRAGLEEIECIVEGMEDTGALIQGWIENAQREDLSALDKARALRAIQDATGWSLAEMERRGVAHNAYISNMLTYLAEYESGAIPQFELRQDPRDQGVEKARHIKQVFQRAGIDDPALKRRVHEHGMDLPREKVRELAEAVAHAEDEAEREAILSTDPRDPMFDRLVKARAQIHRQTVKEERKKREDDPREVRTFLDAVRLFFGVIRGAVPVVEYGKFSPEAKQFAIRQLDKLMAEIQELRHRLEE